MSKSSGGKIETASVVSQEHKEQLLEEFRHSVVKWHALTEGLQLLRVVGDVDSLKALISLITGESDDPKSKLLEVVTNEVLDGLNGVEVTPRLEKKLDELKQTISRLTTHIIDGYLNKLQPTLMMVYHGFVTFEETDGVILTPLTREVTLKQDGELITKEFIHYDVVVRASYEESLLTVSTFIPVLLEKKLVDTMKGAVLLTVDKEGNVSTTSTVGVNENIEDLVTEFKESAGINKKKQYTC